MKNLFKSLMLVAVAAMAFTACQNEPEVVVNNGAESTTITFDATFADTRSQFGEKVEGEGYPSTWTGNEEAIFTHTTYCYQDGAKYVSNTESGAEAHFVVKYNPEYYEVAPAYNAKIVAVTPSSAWRAMPVGTTDWEHTYTIPAQQTPSANSVDEAAHILKAIVDKYNASGLVNLTFEHQVAYGKLSLQDYDGAGVTAVVLDIDGAKYTVNTTATENIWFACEPNTDVQNMTITVNDSNAKGYTKSIIKNNDKDIAFSKGVVSTFTVDMTGVGAGEVVSSYDVEATTCVMTYNYTSAYEFSRFYFTNSDWTSTSSATAYYEINISNSLLNKSGDNYYLSKDVELVGQMSIGYASSANFTSKSNISGYDYATSGIGNSDKLSIKFENDVYKIALTRSNGDVFYYEGMPENMTAPVVGGEEEEEAVNVDGYTKYTLDSVVKGKYLNMMERDDIASFTLKDPVYGDTLTFELCYINNISVSNKTLSVGEYAYAESHSETLPVITNIKYAGVADGKTGSKAVVYKSGDEYIIKIDVVTTMGTLKIYYQGTL